jgi:hypothetical protein
MMVSDQDLIDIMAGRLSRKFPLISRNNIYNMAHWLVKTGHVDEETIGESVATDVELPISEPKPGDLPIGHRP